MHDGCQKIQSQRKKWVAKEATVLRRRLSKKVVVFQHWYSSLWCICMYTCKRIYVYRYIYIYIHEFIHIYISTHTRSDYLHLLLHPLRPCPPADYCLIPCPILNLRCRPAASCWGPLTFSADANVRWHIPIHAYKKLHTRCRHLPSSHIRNDQNRNLGGEEEKEKSPSEGTFFPKVPQNQWLTLHHPVPQNSTIIPLSLQMLRPVSTTAPLLILLSSFCKTP